MEINAASTDISDMVSIDIRISLLCSTRRRIFFLSAGSSFFLGGKP
jgi:hypothetical protein